MGGCLEKFAKVKQTLKKEVFSPWEKKSPEFLVSPWLKFPGVQMDFGRATDLCISIGLCGLPLSPGGLLEMKCQGFLHADVMHWLSRGVAQKRECSICLCHCCGPLSAELEKEEKLTHSSLVCSTHVSTSMQCGEAAGALDRLWTGTGLCAFHTGRKWVRFHFYKQTVQSGPKL